MFVLKLINAYWENRNLGKTTCEINLDKQDEFESNLLKLKIEFERIKNTFEYVVVKIPSECTKLISFANDCALNFVETQLALTINTKKFESNFSKDTFRLTDMFSIKLVNTLMQYDYIAQKISEGMFSTDRIAIDSRFGLDIANLRYSNWIKDMLNDHNYILNMVYYKDEPIGFHAGRCIDGCYHGDLGGVFPKYQNGVYGMYWAYVFLNDCINKYNKVYSFCSTNNISVIKLWEYFGAITEKATYVFTN